jgi:signal transduction histidine kinase
MINNLLEFAKFEAGDIEWYIAELNPRELITSAVASLTLMFQKKHVNLTLALPPED